MTRYLTWASVFLLSACQSVRQNSAEDQTSAEQQTSAVQQTSRKLSNVVAAQELFCVTEGADTWCWGRAEGLIARRVGDAPAIDPAADSRWLEESRLRAELAAELPGQAAAVPLGIAGRQDGGSWGCALVGAVVECGFDADLSPVEGLPPVSQLSVGWNKDLLGGGPLACAWNPGGEVYCWGTPYSNAFSAADRPLSEGEWLQPRAVPAHEGATEIAIDATGRICSLHGGQTVRCTGRYRTNTLQRISLEQVVAIEPMWLAATESGTVFHWGYTSSWGRLLSRPAPVAGADDIVEIFGYTGRRSDGSLVRARRDLQWADLRLTLPEGVALDSGTGCFQVSGWETVDKRPVADQLDLPSHATPLNTCFTHGACGIDGSGDVSCIPFRGAAEKQPDLSPAVMAGGQPNEGCLVRPEGTLTCWNRSGAARERVDVPGPTDIVSLSVSGRKTGCVIESDGELWCWGINDYNTDRRQITPRKVGEISDAVDVAVSQGSACVARRSGELYCWGDATLGRLGNGTGLDEAVEILFSSN